MGRKYPKRLGNFLHFFITLLYGVCAGNNLQIDFIGWGDFLFLSLRFDIVLPDISLPDKNGLEVLQSVKAKLPSLNVLMLSMHPQEQYAVRALKLGA